MPQISVIIPLYNHENYVKESINSVLDQTVEDFELIIINDGSVDGSEEVVKRFKDKRIRYYYQNNKGAHFAINRGIGLARGVYVSILNSDDCYTNDRFEKCLNILTNDISVDAVFSGVNYIDEKGNSIKITLGSEENYADLDEQNSFKGLNNLTLDLLAGNFLKTSSNLFSRKDCFEKIGLFCSLRYAHDYDFFLRLSSKCKAVIIREPLLKYRSHPSNTLKEGQASIDLECAIVLLDFLKKNDIRKLVDSSDSEFLCRIFNTLNTHRSEKLLFITSIFSNLLSPDYKSVPDWYQKQPTNRYWNINRDYLQNYHDGWQAREEILKEWDKLYQLYLKCDEELKNFKKSKRTVLKRLFRGNFKKY